ncbi:unsaturated chondroitin disaccharide hydrolase [Micromonospora nigra]|uniref:Unsaturated chondroitin disaccharide hydrolase n=1 Tax=Micromonospora nigra TaxID=145857 RepID=A0A1C6SY44_9ACTN|nr:glycoside hydrolase family 88 protein [Micromonospora nigra]SCL34279.1 unsaturated chondroitin disaccharide hydrolase [Micromonospora nigra]
MTETDVRPSPDAEATAAAVTAAIRTIEANIDTFGARYPADTTVANRYPLRPPTAGQPEGANVGWTTSFWPGMLWLAHDLTGDEHLRRAALSHVDSFVDRVHGGIDLDTHDLGFLYTLACVTAARRTGDRRAREAALAAADHLMTRFLEPAGIIQAWGDLADPRQRGRTIIDSLMNTPLLHWASQTTGDDRYAAAARRHAAQLREHILRPDGTTFHTFYWDPDTGVPLRGETEQGHADHTCWARGQAWGIYGFTLNHRYTGDPSLLVAATTCADHFLARLPADHVAYWDLEFGDGSGEERDSSAAAIAACGLAELAGSVTDPTRAEGYRVRAGRILRSLVDNYASAGPQVSNALLLHGVYDKPKGIGVDEGTLWGDYFYLEALTRATIPGWTSPW